MSYEEWQDLYETVRQEWDKLQALSAETFLSSYATEQLCRDNILTAREALSELKLLTTVVHRRLLIDASQQAVHALQTYELHHPSVDFVEFRQRYHQNEGRRARDEAARFLLNQLSSRIVAFSDSLRPKTDNASLNSRPNQERGQQDSESAIRVSSSTHRSHL